MKDLRVKVTIRNNQLVQRRESLGLTQRELSVAAGVQPQAVTALEALRLKPTRVFRKCPKPSCGERLGTNRAQRFCAIHKDAPVEERERWERESDGSELIVWTDAAQRLARFLDVDPADLFPESLNEINRSTVVKTFDAEELIGALGLGGEDASVPNLAIEGIDKAEIVDAVHEALGTLTERQRLVLTRRFRDEKTYKEVSNEIDRGVERTRQIEQRALEVLGKHPRIRGLG